MRIVDETGFRGRPMIHPDDDIPSIVARRADRQRIGAGVQHHERASRIETQALDGGRRKGGFRHGRPNRSGTCRPDLG